MMHDAKMFRPIFRLNLTSNNNLFVIEHLLMKCYLFVPVLKIGNYVYKNVESLFDVGV